SGAGHSGASDGGAAARCCFLSRRIEPACPDGACLSLGRAGADLGNGALQIARSNRLVQQIPCALAGGTRVRFCLWRDFNRSRIALLLNESSSLAAVRLAILF